MKYPAILVCLLLAAASPQSEDALTRQVRNALVHRHLAPSPQCLEHRVIRNSDPGVDRVDVSARHDQSCGGDPDVDEHLFAVYIDRTTHQMATDAADPTNGMLKPLKP